MKKKLAKVLTAVAIIAMASVNVYWVETQQVAEVAAANIAALTRDEGSGGIISKTCYPDDQLKNGNDGNPYLQCSQSTISSESSEVLYECGGTTYTKVPVFWPTTKKCYVKVN